MYKTITKFIAGAICLQTAIAAPNTVVVPATIAHARLAQNAKLTYDQASSELASKGLQGLFAIYGQTLNSFDRAFVSSKVKGLQPLPKIVVTPTSLIVMSNLVNGKSRPITIEIVDITQREFLINGQKFSFKSSDGIEDIYKKIMPTSTASAPNLLKRLSNLAMPEAHAFMENIDWGTVIPTAIIGISLAVLVYSLGKKSGEAKVKDKVTGYLWYKKQKGEGSGSGSGNGEIINEKNPKSLEGDAIDTGNTGDHSSDVITPAF